MDVGDLFLVVFIIMASADSSIFRSFFMYELFTHTHTHTLTHTFLGVCVFRGCRCNHCSVFGLIKFLI